MQSSDCLRRYWLFRSHTCSLCRTPAILLHGHSFVVEFSFHVDLRLVTGLIKEFVTESVSEGWVIVYTQGPGCRALAMSLKSCFSTALNGKLQPNTNSAIFSPNCSLVAEAVLTTWSVRSDCRFFGGVVGPSGDAGTAAVTFSVSTG